MRASGSAHPVIRRLLSASSFPEQILRYISLWFSLVARNVPSEGSALTPCTVANPVCIPPLNKTDDWLAAHGRRVGIKQARYSLWDMRLPGHHRILDAEHSQTGYACSQNREWLPRRNGSSPKLSRTMNPLDSDGAFRAPRTRFCGWRLAILGRAGCRGFSSQRCVQ